MRLTPTKGVLLIAGLALVTTLILGGCAAHNSMRRTDASAATGPVRPRPVEQADNAACLDCHLDLADELIVSVHLKKGFACTACHGSSVAHGEDEANVTKPDVVFGRAEIEPFCKLCHTKHTKSDKFDKFVQQWRGKRGPTGVMILNDATCMDCHGRHFIAGGG